MGRLHNFQESCRAKKQKVSETVAEAFDLTEELFLGDSSTDLSDGNDEQSVCLR